MHCCTVDTSTDTHLQKWYIEKEGILLLKFGCCGLKVKSKCYMLSSFDCNSRNPRHIPYFFIVSLLLLLASAVALVAQSGIFLNVIEILRSLTLGMQCFATFAPFPSNTNKEHRGRT